MRLSWNEMRARASAFSQEWKNASYERGESQSFYNDFFQVFGVRRRQVALYERRVQRLNDTHGYIDLFWPGVLLVEQKSAGRDLRPAKEQAEEYCLGLTANELPRFLLVSDFQTFELHDLERGETHAFQLQELAQQIELFGFVIGVERRDFKDQDPANIEAAELMGRLHDSLEESGYVGERLEQFLVRLLFCLFADDTGIFEPRGVFQTLVEDRTSEDGADLGMWISMLFEVLNTPPSSRQSNLDEELAQFPFVNGELFRGSLSIPSFTAKMRGELLDACSFSWDAISPAIFGSLFQSVMDRQQRRAMGAHYTTEKNIRKVIDPLFLDGLREEFRQILGRKTKKRQMLKEFQQKLSRQTFLDPACGCGNFLVIAYRELRQLELEALIELRQSGQLEIDASLLSMIDVDQFFGIEISEFPVRIAEVALWMMDHIMNNKLSLEFGKVYVRVPLKKSPQIVIDNALRIDWNDVLPAESCTCILGNPPFVGHQYRSKAQKEDMGLIWGTLGQVNRLDYVTCWFLLARQYAEKNRQIRIGFVATNSISQGEQAGILWPRILADGMEIVFCHRTFQWNSEARGKAAVHCVIVGMTPDGAQLKTMFDYTSPQSEPHSVPVSAINGYLVEGPAVAIPARTTPSPGLPPLFKGSQPTDGARVRKPGGGYERHSNLILEEADKDAFLAEAPEAEKWLRPYVGGEELLSGQWRWCLWLKGADPQEMKACKPLTERLDRVRRGRLQSPTKSVRDFAHYPHLFTQDRQPDGPYLAMPEVSSETREYIPMAMLNEDVIASNQLRIVPGANLMLFAVLTSAMHMAWVRVVGGRLESRYRYEPAIYNSFPWPEMSARQERRLVELAQAILEVRQGHTGKSLGDLYDPDWMPKDLRAAHGKLDKAVDRLYRKGGFASERERLEHLFERYQRRQLL